MFELEDQLERWKTRFTGTGAMRRDDIEELEQHVRDSVAAWTSRGLDLEEAFVLATYRVGLPGPVAREFAKVTGGHFWSQRLFWMTAGALGYLVCGLVIGAMASLGQIMVSLAGGTGPAAGYAALGVTCLGWCVLAAWLYRHRNGHPRKPRLIALSATAIGSIVAGAVVVGMLMKFGSQWVLIGLMSAPDLSRASLISNAAGLLVTVIMPFVLFAAMLVVGRRVHEDLSD